MKSYQVTQTLAIIFLRSSNRCPCHPRDQRHDRLADIKERQRGAGTDEACLPLGRTLADDGAAAAVGDAQRQRLVELGADELVGGAQRAAQRAEEGRRGAEAKRDAGARGDAQGVGRVADLVDDEPGVGLVGGRLLGETCVSKVR